MHTHNSINIVDLTKNRNIIMVRESETVEEGGIMRELHSFLL